VKPLQEITSTAPEAISPRLSGKRVVAVVYSSYPADPRPRRAAEALVKEGASVEVICLKENDAEPRNERFGEVGITRVPLKRRRAGKLWYILQYGFFLLRAGSILAGRACRHRYDLVHIHNMPDILVFSALVPKILGAKVILDFHDPMPELMMTIFDLREDSGLVWLLKQLEKWSIAFADAALTANEAFRKIFSGRSCSPEKMTVIMNSPDEEIFSFQAQPKEDLVARNGLKPFVIMYHGSLVERHGLDLAVAALGKIRPIIPQAELRIYGQSTPFLEQVMDRARKLELEEAIRYFGPKNLEQIAEAIRECDIGIIPNRRSIFTEINMPTRIFEYLSQGKPVIAPHTEGIRDYFDPEELILFELGDSDDLASQLAYAFRHPAEVAKIVERGQEVYRKHQWSSERSRFVNLVAGLLRRATRPAVQTVEPLPELTSQK
jgi:glycosyltransferase involved in cell wall biosynthesis